MLGAHRPMRGRSCHDEGDAGAHLPRVQVDEPEVVRDDPLERVEVESSLEARDRRDVPLLAEEAHADVVPQLRRVGRLHRGDSVLDQRDVHVRVVLDDRAGGEDGLRVARVVGERVAEVVEGLVVLAQPQVQQPDSREQLWVLGGELERLVVDLDRLFTSAPASTDTRTIESWLARIALSGAVCGGWFRS